MTGWKTGKFGSVVNNTSAWRGGHNVNIKLKLDEVNRRKRRLLAISISGLLLAPAAFAEQSVSESAPTTPQGEWNPYAAPGAVPPPPGPYGPPPGAGGPRFRPAPDLEGSTRGMPPGMPADFSDRAGRGSLTRQQFTERQEVHRKQLEEQFQQREAEMNKRVEDMQKRMDAMQAQSEAERSKRHEGMGMPPPPPAQAQSREEAQKRWEQQKAEQAQRWEQQKAAQEQRMQQMKAEHEQQLEQMKAQQEQRIQARPQYRPMDQPPVAQPETATAPAQAQPAPQQAAPQQAAPAYGYPPRGYGYGGYPPPPYGYGYGGPAGAYPQNVAPAPGGQQGVR